MWRSYRYRVAVVKALQSDEPIRVGGIRAWLPLAELNRCHIVPPLDFDLVHEAMELLSGEHDFRSFKGVSHTPEENERSTVRDVTDFRLRPAAPLDCDDPLYEKVQLWEFHIRSKSFLYRQAAYSERTKTLGEPSTLGLRLVHYGMPTLSGVLCSPCYFIVASGVLPLEVDLRLLLVLGLLLDLDPKRRSFQAPSLDLDLDLDLDVG
ncbi:hypothetical protein HPB51_025538 [Rhipicephalus microplus]|uniref:Pseudouridine synthase I TruA alpha/beta domain-containing protein n=1 Tax=Rhipicephalus microplus TaxID=6941 RepID=A0A9J6F6G8_RHIMP|nr:hypothetical protein HPB51_025538 [Rhipicephalus microplus]